MAQLRPGLLLSDAFGSAGDITAYHRGGKCFLRKRIVPGSPAVSSQTSSLSVHRRALQAWRSLSHEEQLQWEPYARLVEPHRPPFDHLAYISGNNLFVSAYHGFATLGNEHIPVPVPFEPFPSYLVKIQGASAVSGDLVIRLQLEIEDPEERYRLLCKLYLTRPGAGRNPGMLRNYLAVGTAGGQVSVTIPDYVSVSGLDLPAYQVHGRFILLDTITGFRSHFIELSDRVSLY